MRSFTVRPATGPEVEVFHRQGLIEGWRQQSLREARVMVVGAGAIGNEVLKNLALLGVGYLFVVDLDEIDSSNLSRTVLFRREDVGGRKAEIAAIRTRDLCLEPTARVDWYHGDVVHDLGTGVFESFDLVLGCVDNLEARLAINRQCWLAGTPWIDAGMRELATRVCTFEPPDSACFECTVSPAEMAQAGRRYSCEGFKRAAAQADLIPTTQITGALVAALQTQEAVRRLTGGAAGEARHIHFQGTVNDFAVLRLPRRDDCAAHVAYPHRVPYPGSGGDTLRAFLDWVSRDERSGAGAVLDLSSGWELVRRLRCPGCGIWWPIHCPKFRVSEAEGLCAGCRTAGGEVRQVAGGAAPEAETLTELTLESTPADVLELSLQAIGVPLLAVLPVRDRRGTFGYYQVAGDRARLLPGLDGGAAAAGRPRSDEEE